MCVCWRGGALTLGYTPCWCRGLLCCWALLSLPPGILSVPNICLLSRWETEWHSCLLISQTQVLPVVYGWLVGATRARLLFYRNKIQNVSEKHSEKTNLHRVSSPRIVGNLHLYSSVYCILAVVIQGHVVGCFKINAALALGLWRSKVPSLRWPIIYISWKCHSNLI